MDFSKLTPPAKCYVDFCLVPVRLTNTTTLESNSGDNHGTQVGTGKVSVAEEVAEVQRLLKQSGLKYTMHSAGTTVGK